MSECIREANIFGCHVVIHDELGHIAVHHDGDLTWDRLYQIKNIVWGLAAQAIEVYPRADRLVNNANCRHLWRLGDGDFCPDLLGRSELGEMPSSDSLETRYRNAWREVR